MLVLRSFHLPFKILNKKLNNPFSITTQKQPVKMRYKFDFGVGFKPHPNKIIYGGDDFHLASDNILAIADGVGAWNQNQNEPSLYAKKTIQFIQKIYKNQKRKAIENPIYAADQAIKLVKVVGSTTLTIITLHPQTGQLKTYYIGDSVYGFFRKQDIEMTSIQMVSFNRPYQVGHLAHPVQDGYQNTYPASQIGQDLIVLASDGLWDNLSLDRIHYEIRGPGSKFKNGLPKSLNELAEHVVELTYKHSFSSNYLSPIYKRAEKQGVKYPKQGKVDDITLILAQIVKVQMKKGQSYF